MVRKHIVPALADLRVSEVRRKPRARILPLKVVEQLRPARDEIIIATGVRPRCSQVQHWSWLALGFLVERRHKG